MYINKEIKLQSYAIYFGQSMRESNYTNYTQVL